MGCEFVVDLDGVLADFFGGVAKLLDIDLESIWDPGSYELPASTGLRFRDLLPKLSAEWWASLDWTPDAESLLWVLEPAFKAGRVTIATSPGRHPAAGAGKIMWCEARWPKQDIYMIGKHKHKLANPYTVLIDDDPRNISKFRANGGHAVLVPRLWNERHVERHRAMDVVAGELTALGFL